MSHYEKSAGRGIEIVIGLLVLFVALIFGILLSMLLLNASLHLSSLISGLLLIFVIYWFGQIAYRLLFNKPRKNGGIFSVGGLKFWCVFMSLSFICTAIFAIQLEQWSLLVSAVVMVIACSYGWRLANNREQQKF